MDTGARGYALIELLLVITLIGFAGAAVVTTGRATSLEARTAVSEGRRAMVAVRALSLVRTGLVTADSGSVRLVAGGEPFDATYIHRDGVLAGGVELRIEGPGRRVLVFDVPLIAP
ncbi:MAG: type II secretion system GspH family protein [Gemmatimonadota bacterium]|nr:type II secretion system GspH family protein [Gemmatimonadota bacterium]